MKPVVRRAASDSDVEAMVDDYLRLGGAELALGFVDALEAGYAHLSRHPATGSPRYGQELAIPGLRAWPLGQFPYLVFYFEFPDRVEVWRVLHERRDLPAHLQSPDR